MIPIMEQTDTLLLVSSIMTAVRVLVGPHYGLEQPLTGGAGAQVYFYFYFSQFLCWLSAANICPPVNNLLTINC